MTKLNLFHLYILLLTPWLFYACVNKPVVSETRPTWINYPTADTPRSFVFRGMGSGEKVTDAIDTALEEMSLMIIEKMNFGDPKNWRAGGQIILERFKEELFSVLRSPDYYTIDGLDVIKDEAWPEETGFSYAIEAIWERESFIQKVQELIYLIVSDSQETKSLGLKAKEAVKDGNPYEAALIWASIASIAHGEGHEMQYGIALAESIRILNNIKYQSLSAPKTIESSTKSPIPFTFQMTYLGQPVKNAEFIITYPLTIQNGSATRGVTRFVSDNKGIIVFNPPSVFVQGNQRVSLAPSANPFIQILQDNETPEVVNYIRQIERSRIDIIYEIVTNYRSIPTGIVILETDTANKLLTTNSATSGIANYLNKNNFNVSILPVNIRNLYARNEKDFLQNLRTNDTLLNGIDRVIYGKLTIENFNQTKDAFVVRVKGTLYLSEIDTQNIIFQSNLTKTSRAGDVQQAINSAFRQLGRSFATEIVNRAR